MTDPLDAATPERPPNASTPGGHRPPVTGQWADRLAGAVYVAVAVVALVGQATAATHWLGWPLPPALGAVSVVELAAIAVAARADYRRRLGEAAVAARILSAFIAAFMTAVNWFGHWLIGQQVAAYFFAGTTLVGYLIWLLHSAARRRDQLRAEGKLQTTTPEYGAWQWLRHPIITRRARQLALRDPQLGLYKSLDQATADLRKERRNRALSRALEQRVTAKYDANMAEIATTVYDMDEIAVRLADGADYEGLTALIAEDLTPERLAASTTPQVIDGEVVAGQSPTTEAASEPEVDSSTGDGQDAHVVPIRPASTRPRPRRGGRPATRRPATAATPDVDELADTLCREHCTPGYPAVIGKPTAVATLRRVYGSCGGDRAREAKDVHNARHASTSDQADDGDDQESEAVVA